MFGRVVRYVGGAAAAWLVFTLQGVLVYLGLLLYALASGTDAGGPLGGPFMLLLAAALGLVLIPVLYVPTLVAVEVVGKRVGFAGRLVTAAAVMVVLVGAVVALVAALTDVSPGAGLVTWLVALASVVLPAVAATAVVYGGAVLARLFSRLRAGDGPSMFGGFRSV
ncbi:hypothetical protein [Micromonospora sp. NPDC047074]|uniref:hypothetical protein n=1 Tax=Micromonospora sp. NPDC047074 TaxID=3154339 RepID=UPI0033F2CABE